MNQCDARYCHLLIWCKYRDLNYSKWRRKCRRTTNNVACVQTPPLLSEGRGLLYTGYKKTLAEKKTLEYHKIMRCVILTLNAIIWYLPPRLSWVHKGLSQKKKTLKIKGSKMSPFLTTSFWVSPFALQIRFNLLGRGCHIQTHRLFPGWDTLVRIFPST